MHHPGFQNRRTEARRRGSRLARRNSTGRWCSVCLGWCSRGSRSGHSDPCSARRSRRPQAGRTSARRAGDGRHRRERRHHRQRRRHPIGSRHRRRVRGSRTARTMRARADGRDVARSARRSRLSVVTRSSSTMASRTGGDDPRCHPSGAGRRRTTRRRRHPGRTHGRGDGTSIVCRSRRVPPGTVPLRLRGAVVQRLRCSRLDEVLRLLADACNR